MSQGLIGNLIILIWASSDPGDDQCADRLTAGLPKRSCRLIQRCAGGQYIIDQQYMAVPDSCLTTVIELKRMGEILFALGLVETGLAGCCLVTMQQVWGKQTAIMCRRQAACQLRRLIVTAVEISPPVQRNRYNQTVRCYQFLVEPAEHGCKNGCQRQPVAMFEFQNDRP